MVSHTKDIPHACPSVPRMSLKHDNIAHDFDDFRHSLDSQLSHSSRLHSLKASSVDSDDSHAICPGYDDQFTGMKSLIASVPDSGFDSTGKNYVAGDANNEDDEKHEKRCVEDAKMLVTQCVCSSTQLNKYSLRQLLGYGTFGIVVEAVDPVSHQSVAIKIMRKSQIHQNRVYHDPETGKWSSLEVVLLKYAPPNENIISFIDSWDDSNCLYLVTELSGHSWNYDAVDTVSGYPLSIATLLGLNTDASMIRSNSKPIADTLTICLPDNNTQTVSIPLSPNDRSSTGFLRAFGAFNTQAPRYLGRPVVPEVIQKRIFRQLASSLMTLHQHGITHKDIKDENVLLDKDLNLRLIDFGHAAVYRTQNGDQIKTFKTYGTPVFSPPESRSGIDFHGPSADIYALGLMLYEYNYGDVPDNFDEALYEPQGDCIFEISENTGFGSKACMDLCKWMLQPDPVNRATIEDVISHPYLAHD